MTYSKMAFLAELTVMAYSRTAVTVTALANVLLL